MWDSDRDVSQPLLVNDELALNEPSLHIQLGEQTFQDNYGVIPARKKLVYLWRCHKRRFFLILPAAVVATLLAILLFTVNPAANNTAQAVPEVDEKLAHDSRLDVCFHMRILTHF
jgi:hypothetical protein